MHKQQEVPWKLQQPEYPLFPLWTWNSMERDSPCFQQNTDEVIWKDYPSGVSELASNQTNEGLNLKLMRGDVTCFSTEVIVNTVPQNLQLGRGPLSQSLLQKGGPMLQEELSATQENTTEKLGSMFLTSGCNLDCKAVLHVVAPHWNNGDQSSLQIMRKIIEKCLTNIEQQTFQSITFPMIGTGRLEFPKFIFADLILSEVIKFSRSSWKKSLQEVYFVVLPDDDQGHQAFLNAFTGLSSETDNMTMIPNIGRTHGVIMTVSNPLFTMNEMKLGGISFQVATGDITKEKADVIVNSTNRTFNAKSGVSEAILEGAGRAVENECAVLATQTHRDYIITQGGYLQCKIIIHVPGENDVRKTVSCVLEECEQRKYTSVSLPVIGAGNAGKNPDVVADDIIDSVVDFAYNHFNTSLKIVKVVIFEPELMKIFCGKMKQRETCKSLTFQSSPSKTAFEIPLNEDNMKQKNVSVIALPPHNKEYQTVARQFARSCPTSVIKKIERILNPGLWKTYQTRKNIMDNKNGNVINEKQLFHGTDVDSVPHINKNGFNRSYAGKNGTAFGKGTYFAVNASYSDTYATPDTNGEKYMYYVRVLTGVYTHGNPSLIEPPPKYFQNSTDLYDSVTDDVQNPKLFVVFYDYQAYPDYLITYR